MLSAIVETTYNLFDQLHTRRLRRFYATKSFDAVIDVGSHKGEFINLVVTGRTPIYSFEPQSAVRDELKRNTADKNVVEYFDCAVSDRVGTVDFYLNSLSSTSSIKAPASGSPWIRFKTALLGGTLIKGKTTVAVQTLDTALANRIPAGARILLKIDVEGAEGEVLRGARNLFATHDITAVQIEQASYRIYSGSEVDPVRLLAEYGYDVEARFLFPLLNFSDIVFCKRRP